MVVQANKPGCGGAREGGNRAGAVEASLVSRWVRGVVQGCTVYGPKDGIFSITAGSSIQAMIRGAPPQADTGQAVHHGFEEDHPEAVALAGHDEQGAAIIQSVQLLLADPAQELHVVGHAQRLGLAPGLGLATTLTLAALAALATPVAGPAAPGHPVYVDVTEQST